VIDDYIDLVKIDAKHSFEENVIPVQEVKKRWGNRMSLLGGMDVDFLVRNSTEAVRRKTREILEACHPGGGYFLGSGNWVTEYVPLDNYIAMLDEGRRFGQ
jgi:uroporphyrinogen decarboxylase